MQDVKGKELRIGDMVRVMGTPDLSNMAANTRRESLPLFEHILGSRQRVRGIDEGSGWVGIELEIRTGPLTGRHTVWIEPELLKRVP